MRRTTPCNGRKRIVYVLLHNPEILPRGFGHRTHGPWVIRSLRSIVGSDWEDFWSTLTVYTDYNGRVQWEQDGFSPRYLPAELLVPHLPVFDATAIVGDEEAKHRGSCVRHVKIEDRDVVLKSYPFEAYLPWFAQEAKCYKLMTERGCRVMPKLLGYIYEGNRGQVNGIVLDKINGRHPRVLTTRNVRLLWRSCICTVSSTTTWSGRTFS